jgi:hypothetical protein
MSNNGPQSDAQQAHDDDVKHDVPKPEEVDPESGTDAEGDPVENPSG